MILSKISIYVYKTFVFIHRKGIDTTPTNTRDVYPLLMEMRRMIMLPTRAGMSLNCGTDL